MSFVLRHRTWSSKSKSKTVSLALIVSTWVLLFTSAFIIPVVVTDTSNSNVNKFNTYSNITLLDLYPELKEHLWKKALSQLNSASSTTENYNYNSIPKLSQQVSSVQPNVQNSWGLDSLNYNPNLAANALNSGSGGGGIYNSPGGYVSRGDYPDSDPADSYNYQKEVLKYFQPFGSPEIYDAWKYKPPSPSPPEIYDAWKIKPSSSSPSAASYSWSSSYPIWEEEEPETGEHVHHELSKDFSCLAGLLGLKTLKKLKIALIFKKLKYIGLFIIAFKLGVLLSPIAIPLLFPIIILVTAVKILPLILIIILLLKILKKQVKIKKPFGKFLDNTGSLFFDDVDSVTEKVLNSEECVDKINCNISKKSGKVARINSRRLES